MNEQPSSKARRKRAGLRRGEVELVLHLTPNSEAIQKHWNKWPDLGRDDHSTAQIREVSPEVACLIREIAATLESEGFASEIEVLEMTPMHGRWCIK